MNVEGGWERHIQLPAIDAASSTIQKPCTITFQMS